MNEIVEVECNYCGSFIEVSRAVKINLDTGEYEYLCDNCALKFKKKSSNQFNNDFGVDDEKKAFKRK